MIIRALEKKDRELMMEWMQDDEIVKNFQTDFKSFSREKVEAFIEDASKQTLADNNLSYAIVDEDDSYLGTISLKNINREHLNAEYAIVTRKEAHGKGFAKRASEAILKIAFEDLALEKVYLYVSVNNIGANKFYQKIGFVEEGVFRKHTKINGELTDIRWYSILKDEYLKRTV